MRLDPARRFVGLVRPAHLGALLRLGPQPLAFSFSAPSRKVWATGVGVAAEGLGEVRWLESPAALPPGPWFGGWAFDAQRRWAGFDDERWVLPEVLAWWDGAHTWLAAFGDEGTRASVLSDRLEQVETVEAELAANRTEAPRRVGSHTAAGAEFRALVSDAVTAIEAGQFDKVVVARCIEVAAAQSVSERALLKSLEARNPDSFTFLVRGRDGSAFIGASPELLCFIKDGVLSADALAGTALPGHASALLESDKDLREHRAVIAGVRASLEPFSASVEGLAQPGVRVLPNVVHLHTLLRATLRPGVADLSVARALSPTPAVCGAPTAPAREWLRSHESFSRGWYAGAVGFTGPNGTMLSVALRSALLRGEKATVFVGAGIVRGSTPDAEWLETEQKARTLLTALGVEHA